MYACGGQGGGAGGIIGDFAPGNAEDKNVPTLVQALVGHKIVGVDCGSDDAHTLALESNGWFMSCDLHQHVL